MRPLELTLEGFRSYKDEATFSFEDRTLFAIVGPTGAGKSTILDALVFALYGKTLRHQRDIKKLINTGSDEARVRLLFEAEGTTWELIRMLRNKGQPPHVLRRHGDEGAEASGATAVTERIEGLIGLDFEAFSSSVVLPQGEFDRFLAATKKERSSILKGLFRLERVDALRETAKERAGELKGKLDALAGERLSLEPRVARAGSLKEELSRAREHAAAVRDALQEAARSQAELDRLEESLGEIDRAAEQIGAVAGRVPTPEALEEQAESEQTARRLLHAARSESKKAGDAAKVAVEELAAAQKEAGDDQTLRKMRDSARDHARIAAEIDKLDMEEARVSEEEKKAASAVESAASKAEEAIRSFEDSRTNEDSLRHNHAAHLLRKDLSAGDPCPVCGQKVAKVPAAGRAPALAAAAEAVTKAEQMREKMRAILEDARRSLALASERLAKCTASQKEARQHHEQLTKVLKRFVGDLGDPMEELNRRESLVAGARSRLEAAREAAHEADVSERSASEQSEVAAVARRKIAAILIEACGSLRIPPPDVDAETSALLGSTKRAADEAAARLAAIQKRRSEVEGTAEELSRNLSAFRDRFGLAEQDPVAKALEDANAAIGSFEAGLKDAEEAARRTKKLDAEVTSLRTRRDLYDRLAKDLTDTGLIAYLLNGQMRLLSQIGSEKLHELTGCYRFDDEGEFEILDERTGQTRTSDTLSGGETFLASLALALALSEAVSRLGGSLGCFFLDEGFGSLDVESLERALDGIESLAVPGRLIGLISHVREMQSLDDLIVLDRNPDGTTRLVQTEGPIEFPAANI